MTGMGDYPEHEKLALIKAESQSIGQFLDWLTMHGITLMRWETVADPESESVLQEMWVRHGGSITGLLAEYFEIDLTELEREKQEMLDAMRRA